MLAFIKKIEEESKRDSLQESMKDPRDISVIKISESFHMFFFMAAGRNAQNVNVLFFKKGIYYRDFDQIMCLNLEKLKGAFII